MKPATFMFPMFALTTINDGEYRLLSLHTGKEDAWIEQCNHDGRRQREWNGRVFIWNADHKPLSYEIVTVPAGTSVDDLERVIEAAARLRASGVGVK